MGVLGEGLHALMDEGLPPPDEVGYELEQVNGVAAEAELAWLLRKLVLLMPVHVADTAVWMANGWKTVVAENDWPQRVSNELI
jgi:hypothetical protein